MKTNFIRKATSNELIPQDEFVIEKEVVIDKDLFECFIKDPLNDYDFIKENLELIFCDNLSVFQCIFVTSDSHDFGILVESEGYHYARYTAYLPKAYITNRLTYD
ncbi:MAG: hypothetical protein GX228_11170 [Firmicutes bacterium]|jgi:hypothetical protein|nr:hypothetical protein [Bacillota bacterium]